MSTPSAAPIGQPAVAPAETFEPEHEWFLAPGMWAVVTAALKLEPPSTEPLILDMVREVGQGLAVWAELAPHAFKARTLTPATASMFVMLCRAVAKERGMSVSDADHRGLMQRIGTWKKDFAIAPLGKPMYAAEPVGKEEPKQKRSYW